MYLIEKVIVDAHDYDGTYTMILTVAGKVDEVEHDYICTALLEPYARIWGYTVKDLKTMNKCHFDFENKQVKRSFVYQKWFPPRYYGGNYNQQFTPAVRKKLDALKKKSSGNAKCKILLDK